MRLLLAGLVAGLAWLSPAPAATAAPATPPATCTGVWVVVDATALGGEVTTSCAASHATGTEALASAGIAVARSGSMLCQLDGLPDACSVSASAYWSYWQAAPDGGQYGAWSYANLGPDSYHPRGGDAEGWVFGDGHQPPSQVPAGLAEAGVPTVAPTGTASREPSSTPAPIDGQGAGSPIALIAVVAVAVVAALGIWLARRRAR